LTLLRFSRNILRSVSNYHILNEKKLKRNFKHNRKGSKVLLIVFLLFSILAPLKGQYLLDKWTTDDGLPQNSVNAIIQTRDGYIWIGTYGGFARFDGISFTQIDGASKGLRSNRILALDESYDGGIWIGTEGGGVVKYLNGSFIHYGKEVGLSDELIFCLLEDQDSVLWIGSRDGVQCMKQGKILPRPFDNIIRRTSTRSIYQTKTNELFINSDAAVYRIWNKSIEVIYENKIKTDLAYAFLFQDDDGRNWFRGPRGLIIKNKTGTETISMQDGLQDLYIVKVVCDSTGTYWTGAMTNGITYGNIRPKKKFTQFKLSDLKQDYKIQTCFIDREGNRWIGTDGEGLVRLKNRLIDNIGVNEGLKHQIIEAVFEDSKSNLWVGTNDGGLYRKSKQGWYQFTKKDGISDPYIWSLAEDHDGSIWIGSYGGGVYRYTKGKITNYSTENGLTHGIVLALYCDRRGAVWIGTESGGVNIFEKGKLRSITEKDGLANSCVRVFLQDHAGGMWIGTIGGLNYYHDGKFTTYTTANGLSHNYVRAIYEDADNVLWIGTYGGGLNRMKDGVITQYTIQQGLFDNVVSAILEDENNNLWMSCNRGIYQVNRKELNAFADRRISSIKCIAYSITDGLLSCEANGGFQPAGCKTKEGHLLFPTIKGIALVHPEKMIKNTQPPVVHIEKILVNNAEVSLTPTITIPYSQEQKEIHFTALSYFDPEHISFKYRFEGLSEQWNDLKNRRVIYFRDLAPGEYTFHVIAANSHGVWNTTGASVDIIIEPPFWRTWYFFGFGACIILLFGYLIYLSGERRRQREVSLQRKFTQQLLDSMEEQRKRIASELHDSIGQELLIIKNRSILALNDLKRKKTIKEQLDEISETASQAIQETREISFNLRPYQIDRLGITKAIESIVQRVTSTSKIKFTVDIDQIDGLLDQNLEIHVYRIIQECINNIIKHAQATKVYIIIKRWHNRLNFDIRDNGKGFEAAASKSREVKGFGLQGIEERARLLDGIVRVESTPGQGTRILITVNTNEKTDTTTNETSSTSRG